MSKALWQPSGILTNSMKIFNFKLRQTKTRFGIPPQTFAQGRWQLFIRGQMRKLLLLTVTISLVIDSYSQGLNNEQYQFDQQDAENIASYFMGIDTYKFFVNAKSNVDLDIMFEDYENGQLKSDSKVVSELIEHFGMNPIMKKNGDDFIRVYIKNDLQNKKMIDIRIKYLNLSLPKRFKDMELSTFQTRAFTNIAPDINKKTPLVALYGNKSGAMISCPGDASPEDIIKLYDWVCIMYVSVLETD